MTTEAQKRAVRNYDDKHTTQIHLKLNNETDSDILDRLSRATPEEGGKQGYIKRCIRQEMKLTDPDPLP